ncbi:MAG: adenylate/guanylate cyclase domain-containing protein [Chloroflexota bacterium]
MPEFPTGTVTFLFTDIEGSTKLLQELGPDAYGVVLAEHRRVVRNAIASHGGVEVDTQGDAFFVAFADAIAAAAAARDAQRELADSHVRVRMGLHTGQAHLTDEGYVGSDIHLGARIAAAGHGGQVLVSRATRQLVGDELYFTDHGEHRLKDFAAPVWLYQLGADRFPPLRTISNTNLPRPVSAFVGRAREVADIGALLRDGARLVTLSGPGGTGKTRLAIEAAAGLVPDFRNGVFWVDLAPLRDPALVTATIGQTLGAQVGLAEHIGARQMLLVLDNLEQVIQAAPDLSTLLSTCPNLRMLDTSRELLRVSGEVEYPVPPLATQEAVELFTARAGLPPTESIVELCRRLDNLPLAVELAAARTSVLAPAQILDRIGKRLDLLKGGRDADPRQQTLRATIEWSHDLLNTEEQALFARLAVFGGGCTLEAAEQVVDADLETLQSLVDKSLLQHTGERFGMLETIREFALERLDDSGISDAVGRRHADFFLALAEEAEPNLRAYSAECLERLERDHDNLRAALEYFSAAGESHSHVRLAGSLTDLWTYGGHVEEGWRRVTAALTTEARATAARARALAGAADLADNRDDTASMRLLAGEALEIYSKLGNTWWIAYVLGQLGRAAIEEADYDRAKEQLSRAVDLYRELGDEQWAIAGTRALAWAYKSSGDHATARALHEENLGRAIAAGNQETAVGTLGSLAMVAAQEGRVADAVSLVRDNVRSAVELGSPHEIGQSICRVADIFVRCLNRPEAAARLLGCFDALQDQIGVSEAWVARTNRETLVRIAAVLEGDALTAARLAGKAMTIEQGISFAIEQLDASQ